MTKFKDVAHLYMGCRIQHTDDFQVVTHLTLSGSLIERVNENMKPFLRPLSSMTEDELKEKNELCFIHKLPAKTKSGRQAAVLHDSPNSFLWLLSKGFDIFDLIESGEAIDLTKQPKN